MKTQSARLWWVVRVGCSVTHRLVLKQENAKANGVNVYQYLKLLLEKQPNNQMKDDELEKLAPWNKEVKTFLETRAMEED